jgi:hypothetical protein
MAFIYREHIEGVGINKHLVFPTAAALAFSLMLSH